MKGWIQESNGGAWVMDTRKHGSQIQQDGTKSLLEIKMKAMRGAKRNGNEAK